MSNNNKQRTYTYKRYQRDGTVKEITAVIRVKRKRKLEEKTDGK